MLVSIIRNVIAGIRYSLNTIPARRQLLCNHTVATILPSSSEPPMMITGIVAAENMAVRPATEYQAATALKSNAVARIPNPNIIKIIYQVVVWQSPHALLPPMWQRSDLALRTKPALVATKPPTMQCVLICVLPCFEYASLFQTWP